MKRAIATLVVLGFVFGSAAAARADNKNNKDSGRQSGKHDHKDHGKDKDRCDKDHCDKDHCGKDHCGKDHCGDKGHGMCGDDSWNTIHPIPAPRPKPLPIIGRLPPGAIKPIGSIFTNKQLTANKLAASRLAAANLKAIGAKPTLTQGQIPTLGTGFNGFAGAVGKDVGSAVGMGVTEGLKLVGGVVDDAGKAAGTVLSDVGSAVSDIGGAISSIF